MLNHACRPHGLTLIIAIVGLSCWLPMLAAQEPNSSSVAADKQSDRAQPKPDWPMFRGDREGTGVARSGLPDQLETLWEFKVPRGGFEGSPIVVKNQSDGKPTVYIGDMDGVLFSIDLQTGKKNWEYDIGLGFSASPAYHDGKIFIGDIDGYFWCFDEQGKKLWSFESGAEITGAANFFKDSVVFGSQDAKLYRLKQSDGSLIWEFQTEDQIRCSATVTGKTGFVAGCDAFLHLVDLDKGEAIDKVEIFSPTGSTPAVHNQLAVFGTENADFFGINLKQREPAWKFADEDGQSAVRGSASITDKHVVFGARNRQVYSLDPKTGAQQWTITLRAKVDGSPVIVDDQVIIGSTDGRLYRLNLSDGKTVWQKQFNGGFLASPAVAFDRLIVATERGVVYCLGKKN